MIDLSIVVPVYNEAGSLEILQKEIEDVCARENIPFETLYVDDGSTDGSFQKIEALSGQNSRVRGIRFRKNCGKAAALSAGFQAARGTYIITLDGDLQDNPEEIPGLLKMLREEVDMVSGWKKKRYDPWHKTLPSKLFNWTTRMVSGLRLHDFNCGLKGYRAEVAKGVRIYGELHRYIPVIAHWNGYQVAEKEVAHRPRQYGRSKYGLARLSNGLFDLLTLLFLHRYTSRPLHLFGFVGLCFNLFGLAILVYFLGVWIVQGGLHLRPLIVGGIASVLLGFQIISLGLLAELIAYRTGFEAPVARTVGQGFDGAEG